RTELGQAASGKLRRANPALDPEILFLEEDDDLPDLLRPEPSDQRFHGGEVLDHVRLSPRGRAAGRPIPDSHPQTIKSPKVANLSLNRCFAAQSALMASACATSMTPALMRATIRLTVPSRGMPAQNAAARFHARSSSIASGRPRALAAAIAARSPSPILSFAIAANV